MDEKLDTREAKLAAIKARGKKPWSRSKKAAVAAYAPKGKVKKH